MRDDSQWCGFDITGNLDLEACEKRSKEFSAEQSQLPALGQANSDIYQRQFSTQEVPHCDTCENSCCTAPHVTTLRLRDLERFKRAGFEWAIAPANESTSTHPSIKQVDGKCVFLKANMKCSIYALRPLVCRSFPLQVAHDAPATIRYAASCKSRQSLLYEGQLEDLAQLAIQNFQEKVEDEQLILDNPALLEQLGLLRFVSSQPKPKQYSRNFEKLLSEKLESK